MIASSIYLTGSTIEPAVRVDDIPSEPDWRCLALTRLQRYGLKVVNPLQLAWPASDVDEGVEHQVRRALDLIDQCDALLANLLKPSYGTAMEIFYAYRRGKLVTVVGQSPYSPWVLSHSQNRFEDIDRALDYLIGEPPQFDPVSWALQYESFLAERYEQFPPNGEPDYQFLGGDLPVLVIAPHATAFFRDGEFQDADGFTGSLAHLINRTVRSHVLMSHYCCAADPGWHLETPLRRALVDIVKAGQIGLIIMLLGSPWHESPDLNIDAYGPDLASANDLAARLRVCLSGLAPVGSDASEHIIGPLARFSSDELNLPVLVLRMHKRYRMPRMQPDLFVRVVKLLAAYIEEVGVELLRSAS